MSPATDHQHEHLVQNFRVYLGRLDALTLAELSLVMADAVARRAREVESAILGVREPGRFLGPPAQKTCGLCQHRCDCEHADHFPQEKNVAWTRSHLYQAARHVTDVLTNGLGTFHLCSECIVADHMGPYQLVRLMAPVVLPES